MRRRGRPALRVFALEEAAAFVAAARGLSPERALAVLRTAPSLFFAHARQSGDGQWRVPEAAVRALLQEDVEPALTCAELAEVLRCSPRTVRNAVQAGSIRTLKPLPAPLPQVTLIPRAEARRLLCAATEKPSARSFFLKGGRSDE